MNHPNLKEKFQCYYEKLLLSKTVQLVTFIVKDYVTCEFTWNDLWTSIQRVPAARFNIAFKTVGFFLKIRKKIGKVWRESLARAKRASLTRPTGEGVSPWGRNECMTNEPQRTSAGRLVWGEKKKNRLSVFHTISSFRPGGSKMSSSCQESVHNLRPLCEFDTLGDWFWGRIARVIGCGHTCAFFTIVKSSLLL